MHKTYRKRCCGHYHVKKWQFYAHFYKTLPKSVPKSDLKWRDFAINPYYQHFRAKLTPKINLNHALNLQKEVLWSSLCWKMTILCLFFKNDSKIGTKKWLQMTSFCKKYISLTLQSIADPKINLNHALNLQKEVLC